MPTTDRPGSSTRWRKLRLFVGERDGMRCQRPACQCGGGPLTLVSRQPNTLTLGHIVDWIETGRTSWNPADYRAECARGNYSAGARAGNARRRRAAIVAGSLSTSRSW